MEEKVLETASLAGHILLENGAEIARVEETMERIARHYGVESQNFFVLSNGIFTTGQTGYAKVEFIPFKGSQLERVAAVNQISRDIEAGRYTVEQARERLLEIRASRPKPAWEQILGSAVGSAGFCMIFGGGLLDAAAAFVVGMLLWAFVVFPGSRMSKPIANIVGSALATLLCIVFERIGFGVSLGNMIVGSLIPLIPGVAFTNGIRDIADEDYIAGATRLLDAIMVFFCIAAGVVVTFMADYLIEGQMILVNGTEPDALCGTILMQALAAFVGTVGFSVIFGVPRRNYLQTALVAMIGWVAYLALFRFTVLGPAISTFAATVIVASLARAFASWFKTPSTVYLIPGVFPMIPGGGIFWTTFFLVSSRLHMALQSGMLALEVTAAIVLGIVLVSALPKRLFYRKKTVA
ncbi:MAG: threonine/serine exporter family protein [Bacteroidales bacterium]|nr:threonine/serine exporter family protein [Bacteroidales bacterium]